MPDMGPRFSGLDGGGGHRAMRIVWGWLSPLVTTYYGTRYRPVSCLTAGVKDGALQTSVGNAKQGWPSSLCYAWAHSIIPSVISAKWSIHTM